VQVFRVEGALKGKDLLLVGSRTPLTMDRIKERMRDPRIAAELARLTFKSEADVRAWYVCDEKQLGPAVARPHSSPVTTKKRFARRRRFDMHVVVGVMTAPATAGPNCFSSQTYHALTVRFALDVNPRQLGGDSRVAHSLFDSIHRQRSPAANQQQVFSLQCTFTRNTCT